MSCRKKHSTSGKPSENPKWRQHYPDPERGTIPIPIHTLMLYPLPLTPIPDPAQRNLYVVVEVDSAYGGLYAYPYFYPYSMQDSPGSPGSNDVSGERIH